MNLLYKTDTCFCFMRTFSQYIHNVTGAEFINMEVATKVSGGKDSQETQNRANIWKTSSTGKSTNHMLH